MKPGVEVLLDSRRDILRGRRIGLITNPTGVDARLVSTVERFLADPDLNLVALYGPEHGVRGNAQAGEYVPFHIDEHWRLPVFSLYGQSQEAPPGGLTNIDAFMRAYDTQAAGKAPAADMLQPVDVLVFDIQDVGTRVYTYVATMAYAMQAAAEAGIPFVVLDRPNPINGMAMEGPVLEHPRFSSFIGLYPVPLRHGMTAGELALLFHECFLPRKVDLTVVPLEGWQRSAWFDQTGFPWVAPSPNMPTLDTATVYPGQVMLEGTNLSEGRGTTRPFELFGAPWIDGYTLAGEVNALRLPGVRFREAWFTPTFSKHSGQRCGGCQIHVTDRENYQPVATSLVVLQTIMALSGAKLEFHAGYFDYVVGTSTVREALVQGQPAPAIAQRLVLAVTEFAAQRSACLLYESGRSSPSL